MDATSTTGGLHLEFMANDDAPPPAEAPVHDSALAEEQEEEEAAELEGSTHDDAGVSSDRRHRVEQTFPNKLHYMLDHGLEESEREVITWQPHGRAFLVVNQRRFVNELLPNWFRQNKYQSFQRQLNSYGFQRITQGRDKGAYYHMSFVRGRRELCHNIKRVKIKGNGGRKPSNPETEPNFYLFPPTLPPPSEESGGSSVTKGADVAPSSSKMEGGLASLFPPFAGDVSDRPLAQLLSLGGPMQHSFPLHSLSAQVGEGKPQTHDMSLLSFLSNVKNSSQVAPTGFGSSTSSSQQQQLPHSTAATALSGAPYILTSTMGTSPPAPAFASAGDAAASESLQRSLLQQYNRRMEAEAQAREREQLLAMLLKSALPPQAAAPAPAPPSNAFAGDPSMLWTAVPAVSSPARNVPPPQSSSSSMASSLMQILLQRQQPQHQPQDRGMQGRGAHSSQVGDEQFANVKPEF